MRRGARGRGAGSWAAARCSRVSSRTSFLGRYLPSQPLSARASTFGPRPPPFSCQLVSGEAPGPLRLCFREDAGTRRGGQGAGRRGARALTVRAAAVEGHPADAAVLVVGHPQPSGHAVPALDLHPHGGGPAGEEEAAPARPGHSPRGARAPHSSTRTRSPAAAAGRWGAASLSLPTGPRGRRPPETQGFPQRVPQETARGLGSPEGKAGAPPRPARQAPPPHRPPGGFNRARRRLPTVAAPAPRGKVQNTRDRSPASPRAARPAPTPARTCRTAPRRARSQSPAAPGTPRRK